MPLFPPPAGLDLVRVEVGTETRSYYLHLPEGRATAGAPVLLAFHGGGGWSDHKGKRMHHLSGMDVVADRAGFVAVYPSAQNGDWTDDPADVAYVDAVLDDVLARTGGDPHRVYAVGFSNGGFFAQKLACTRADRFAAVASVAAALPADSACAPSRPTPVMLVAGIDDPVVPYAGGPILRNRGASLGVDATVEVWRAANGCTDAAPLRVAWADRTDDGTTVEETRWCTGPSEVRVLAIGGGGHTWPGGPQFAPRAFVGRVSEEFDASASIWTWLAGHGR